MDTAFINKKYIGNELTAAWKNRDHKIYSNIVTTQLQQKSKKILLAIGVAHAGSLKSIFKDDTAYKLIDASEFIVKKRPSFNYNSKVLSTMKKGVPEFWYVL